MQLDTWAIITSIKYHLFVEEIDLAKKYIENENKHRRGEKRHGIVENIMKFKRLVERSLSIFELIQ